MGFHHVGQHGLKLLTPQVICLPQPLRITGVSHCAWPQINIVKLNFLPAVTTDSLGFSGQKYERRTNIDPLLPIQEFEAAQDLRKRKVKRSVFLPPLGKLLSQLCPEI